MPSIPVYGFDELEPSILNKAKRRVIGLMDMSEEHLTQEPQKDPTNGKQNTDVEQLTEVIYNTIKDIEQLSGGLDDSSAIPNLRMIKPNIADTLRPLRPVLKEGAKQLVGINNSLRKINATYDSIQPNMIYTSLKAFIGLVNSVKILKKTTIKFFDILDILGVKIEEALSPAGTIVLRQTINEGDTDIISPVDTSVDVPPILSTQEPFPPLPPAPFDPEVIIPNYEPLPPPPPRPPNMSAIAFKRKMTKYKALIEKLITDNNLIAPTDIDVRTFALSNPDTTNPFYSEQEIQDFIDAQPSPPTGAPPTGAPSTAPPIGAPAPAPPIKKFNYTQQELDDLADTIIPKLPANITPDQKADIQNAWLDLVKSSTPDLPTEDEIDDMIDDIIDNPFSQAPTALASSSSTPKDTIESLIDSADELIDGTFLYEKAKDRVRDAKTLLLNYQKAKKDTTAKERELRALVNIGEAPYLKASVPIDGAFKKKYPEFGALKTAYMKSRKDLNTNYKKTEKKLESYMDTNKIPNEYIDKPTN